MITMRRLTLGLTRAEVAQKAGLDEKRRVKWAEDARFATPPEDRKRIAKALGVRVNDIFNESGFTLIQPKYDPYHRAKLLPIPATKLYKLRQAKEKGGKSFRLRLARATELPGEVDEYLALERREATASPEVCRIIADELGVLVGDIFSKQGLALLP